jgi:hypothetical protein
MLDSMVSRPEAFDIHPRIARRQVQHVAVSTGSWRQCEFCGCNSNAEERSCCATGRSADRQSWDPA